MNAFTVAKQRLYGAKVLVVVANGAADHAVSFAAQHHNGANRGGVAAHFTLRLLLSDAAALHQVVVFLPVLFKARVRFVVNDFEVYARFDLQPQLLQAHFNDAWATNQNRLRQTQRDQLLRGVQYAVIFPFCQHDTLRLFTRLRENRLHEQVGFVDKLAQFFDVGIKIGNRTIRHAGVHRRFRYRRGDLDDQTRIERLRNNIFRAKAQVLVTVGGGHHFALLGVRQFSNRVDCRQLHLFVNRRCANVQRAAEDEREAQHVVDLVRVV